MRRILDEFGPTMINRRRDADPCAVIGFEIAATQDHAEAE